MSRVRVPRHVARLVMRLVVPLVGDYSASRRLVVDYSASRRLVVDYSTSRKLVVDYSASRKLVVNYFATAAHPGASAHRAARRAARRRLLRLAQAHRRLFHLRRASGCLGTSRGSLRDSSRCSSLTTPHHAARPVTCRAARR
jgi:hypothetical protein